MAAASPLLFWKTHNGGRLGAALAEAAAAPDYFGGATRSGGVRRLILKALRFLAAAFALAFVTTAAAQTTVDEAERGIVRVVVILQTSEGRMLYGSGSGFVVAPNLVVTNADRKSVV